MIKVTTYFLYFCKIIINDVIKTKKHKHQDYLDVCALFLTPESLKTADLL